MCGYSVISLHNMAQVNQYYTNSICLASYSHALCIIPPPETEIQKTTQGANISIVGTIPLEHATKLG